jgi:hypothetical protein
VTGVLRRIITWAIVIFIIYFLATEPHGAAHILHNIWHLLERAFHSLALFIDSL